MYSSFSDEEQEVKMYEEEGGDLDATLNHGEIDDYCKKFIDFIQARLQKKYDLWSSRKRSRGQDQNEGASSQEPHKPTNKEMGYLDPIIKKRKESSDPNYDKPEVLKEEKSPPPRPIHEKEKELVDVSTTKKGPSIFNLQKMA